MDKRGRIKSIKSRGETTKTISRTMPREVNGFKIQWDGKAKGKAEEGSTGANILLGALATHYEIGFEISGSPVGANARLLKLGSGRSGGLLGMRKANKQFEQLTDTLAS